VRGHGYREILGHYYRGVRLGAVPASVAAGSVAGAWVPFATGEDSAPAAAGARR
jgi:hypothetical protein